MRFTRDAAWWNATAPSAGLETAGRSLSEARKHVRMMLALEGIAEVELEEDLRLPPALRRPLERARAAREEAARASAAADEVTSAALRQLIGPGRLSVRDAAELLGMGRSQVAELAAGAGARRTAGGGT